MATPSNYEYRYYITYSFRYDQPKKVWPIGFKSSRMAHLFWSYWAIGQNKKGNSAWFNDAKGKHIRKQSMSVTCRKVLKTQPELKIWYKGTRVTDILVEKCENYVLDYTSQALKLSLA